MSAEEEREKEREGERKRDRKKEKRKGTKKTYDLSLTTSLLIRAIHHEPAHSWP